MIPATDIITRLIGYAEHDMKCQLMNETGRWDECHCGYSAAIADAREFLKGESDGE